MALTQASEGGLKISNAGTNGQFLQKQSGNTGGLTWADASSIGGATGADFDDNVKIRFGTGNDLELWHQTGNSYVTSTGANLTLRAVGHLYLEDIDGNTMADFNDGGAVELYHNNVKTFATEDNGAYIYGPEGGIAQLMFYADEGDDNPDKWRIAASASASQFNLYNFNDGGWETSIEANGSGNVELYFDNAKKLETTSQGVKFTDSNTNLHLQLDTSDGTQGYIWAGSNDVKILDGGGENSLVANKDGAVELYFDNGKKFETTSVGATVSGRLLVSGDYLHIVGNDLYIDDSRKAFFGNNADLQIYHNGSHSYIEDSGTGNLNILTSKLQIIDPDNQENIATFTDNGAVDLYYDNSLKLSTDSTGIFVNGALRGDTVDLADNKKILLGSGDDLEIFHDGSHAWIKEATGWINLAADNVWIGDKDVGDEMIVCRHDGAVELYYDNVWRLETSAHGVNINGDLFLGDNEILKVGGSNDLQIWHDTTNSNIKNTTGELKIDSDTIKIRATNNEAYIKCFSDKVQLFYNDVEKLETRSGGIGLFGHCELRDDDKLMFGDGNDLQIHHNGSDSFIHQTGVGGIHMRSNQHVFNRADGNETFIETYVDSYVKLYYNGALKLETTSSGITVTGSVSTNDINLSNINALTPNEVDGTRGSWTMQEGADDLFLINRSNGKKYKFNLTEVS